MKPYILLQATRRNVSAQNTSSVRSSSRSRYDSPQLRCYSCRLQLHLRMPPLQLTSAPAQTASPGTLRLYVKVPLSLTHSKYAPANIQHHTRDCDLERHSRFQNLTKGCTFERENDSFHGERGLRRDARARTNLKKRWTGAILSIWLHFRSKFTTPSSTCQVHASPLGLSDKELEIVNAGACHF